MSDKKEGGALSSLITYHSSLITSITNEESRIHQSGVPEEPRGQRGDDGASEAGGLRADERRGRGRHARRQHVRLHRRGEEGVGRGHPRSRASEDGREV